MKPVNKIIHLKPSILLLLILLYLVKWWLPFVILILFTYEHIQGKYSLPDLIKKYITDIKDSIKGIFDYLKI